MTAGTLTPSLHTSSGAVATASNAVSFCIQHFYSQPSLSQDLYTQVFTIHTSYLVLSLVNTAD